MAKKKKKVYLGDESVLNMTPMIDMTFLLVVFRDLTEIRHIRSRLLETEKLGAMAKIAGSVALAGW